MTEDGEVRRLHLSINYKPAWRAAAALRWAIDQSFFLMCAMSWVQNILGTFMRRHQYQWPVTRLQFLFFFPHQYSSCQRAAAFVMMKFKVCNAAVSVPEPDTDGKSDLFWSVRECLSLETSHFNLNLFYFFVEMIMWCGGFDLTIAKILSFLGQIIMNPD